MSSQRRSKLPVRTIKLNERFYKLEEWDVNEAHAVERFAEIDYDNEVIRVTLAYGMRRAALYVVHELVHAMMHFSNLQSKDSHERFTLAITSKLTTFWCDNPKLFAWFHDQITDTRVA